MVKNIPSKVLEKKLIICSRATKWWDEEVNDPISVWREAYARHTSCKTTAGWEEYATAKHKEYMVENKKGLWKYIVNLTNEDFDGEMKQTWVGIKGYWVNKQARQTRE